MAPNPRYETPEPLLTLPSLLFLWVEKIPCPAIGSLANKPIKSVTSVWVISADDKEVTGEGPSKSALLMWEPVICTRSIFRSFLSCTYTFMVEATAPQLLSGLCD
ncbi:hypothetical protein [Paraglaciecola sp. L1A13]|uniref:hypothetical protein n=1 Tax=Paraglaciecola sp. L1A13 TaxID=2686359 RepID=UPI001E574604|nr:hypothetical protein [Paraglaciecola sp. L1A13]